MSRKKSDKIKKNFTMSRQHVEFVTNLVAASNSKLSETAVLEIIVENFKRLPPPEQKEAINESLGLNGLDSMSPKDYAYVS